MHGSFDIIVIQCMAPATDDDDNDDEDDEDDDEEEEDKAIFLVSVWG